MPVGISEIAGQHRPTVADLSLEAGLRVNREAAKHASTPKAAEAAFRLLMPLYGQRWRRA